MRAACDSQRFISPAPARHLCRFLRACREWRVRLSGLLGVIASLGCSGTALADNWNNFTLAGNGSASRSIAAVSRVSNSMEVWWIAPDGSVRDAYWYDGAGWKQFQLAPPGSAALQGGIAAVSRIPNSMEVWWVAPNGSVQDAYWYDGAGWKRFQLAPQGSAATKGGIAAVSRIATSMEVWWAAPNGSVQDAYWYDGAGWKQFQLAPAGSASAQGGIAAVARIPTSMEVWWPAPNGSVQDAYWYDGVGWKQFQLAPAGSASAQGGIAAVSRIQNSMELWWPAPNGSVQDAYWYDGAGWKQFQLAPAGSASAQSGITAVSRIPTSMEVWWTAPNGSVQDAYWYDGQPWKRFELAGAGNSASSGGIAVVSRIPDSMEVWWVGPKGTLRDAYWYDTLQDEWYAYRHDGKRDGAQPSASSLSDPNKVGTLHCVWSWPADGQCPQGAPKQTAAGPFRASPIVVNDTVLIGSDNGYFYALDAASGALKWQYPPPSNPPLRSPNWTYGIQSSAAYWDRRRDRSGSVKGGIAAVSRVSSSMEVWWIAPDGSVHDAYWYDGQPWKEFELAPPGSASLQGGIAAVSRVPNSMEVWWIAPNGSVQDAYWYDGAGWKQFQLAPAGSASLQSGIAAVSRVPNSMELWWTAPNGSVQDAYWYDGAGWKQFQLAPAGSASLQGGFAAVSRIAGSMEVWWVAPDGSVQDAYWYDGAGWKQFQLAPAGNASVQGGIAAVSRISNSMEVWWAGRDGSVQDAYWYDGAGWKQFQLAPAGSASVRGRITARSRIPGSMEVWWAGRDGSVQDAYWYDGAGWSRFQLAPAGSASPDGGMASTSRVPGSMEIWWIGTDGSMQDAYWYDGQPWNRFGMLPDAVIFGAQDPALGPFDGSGHAYGSARLFALDARTGAAIWKSDTTAEVNGNTPNSDTELHQVLRYTPPLIFDHKAYVGVESFENPIQIGRVIAVDLDTGHIVPSFQFQAVGTPLAPLGTVRGGGVWNGVATDGAAIFFTTGNTNRDEGNPPLAAEPVPNHGVSMIRVDKGTGGINWAYQPVPYSSECDSDWSAGAVVMNTSCGELIASMEKDGWSYAIDAQQAQATPSCPLSGHSWQFPPTTKGCQFPPNTCPASQDQGQAQHGDDDYRRPGAAWNDVFIAMTGGESRVSDGVAAGYGKLHALNACAASEKDRVRWIMDIPGSSGGDGSIGAATVTGGVVFIGTDQGHLVVLGDPSVVPAAGSRCSNVDYTTVKACTLAGYSLVPIPKVLANVPIPDGGNLVAMRNEPVLAKGRVFVGTDQGHVYMLAP